MIEPRPINKTEFRELELNQQVKLLTTSVYRLEENAIPHAIESVARKLLELETRVNKLESPGPRVVRGGVDSPGQ